MNITFNVIKSAFVSLVLMALLQVAGYLISLGDLWKIDVHTLVNISVISLATGLVSLIKNVLTTDNGNFVGLMKVIYLPDSK